MSKYSTGILIVEMHDATEGNKRGELQHVVSSGLRGKAVLGQNKKESHFFFVFIHS